MTFNNIFLFSSLLYCRSTYTVYNTYYALINCSCERQGSQSTVAVSVKVWGSQKLHVCFWLCAGLASLTPTSFKGLSYLRNCHWLSSNVLMLWNESKESHYRQGTAEQNASTVQGYEVSMWGPHWELWKGARAGPFLISPSPSLSLPHLPLVLSILLDNKKKSDIYHEVVIPRPGGKSGIVVTLVST